MVGNLTIFPVWKGLVCHACHQDESGHKKEEERFQPPVSVKGPSHYSHPEEADEVPQEG